MEDPDRCRICRGEGTQEEELFYPCKCNGSIKFVHQSCLVEWLSHSQKKHCELCKTPFRFTKLYDANMPQSVPIPIFLRQAAVHAGKTLLTYLRFHLVVVTWLLWLPWCMRAVWRGFFWIGDGGWMDWQKISLEAIGAQSMPPGHQSKWTRALSSVAMAPEALTSLITSAFSSSVEEHESMIADTFQAYNHEPLSFRVVRSIYHLLAGNSTSDPASTTSAPGHFALPVSNLRPPSWLSDVSFLRSLTRSTVLNNIIIDTLEGQIITMSLVVVFIVLFLIREWVVQQQQNIFLGPDEQNVAQARPVANQENDQDVPVNAADGVNAPVGEVDLNIGQRRLLQPRGRLRRRATNPEGRVLQTQQHRRAITSANDVPLTYNDGQAESSNATEDHSDRPTRPKMLQRGATSGVEVRRNLEDFLRQEVANDSPGVEALKRLWSRAGQDASVVLRIIREEGIEEESQWIVDIFRYLQEQSDEAKREFEGGETEDVEPMTEQSEKPEEKNFEAGEKPDDFNMLRPNTSEREQHLTGMLTSTPEPLFPSSRPEDHPDTWHLDQPALVDVPIERENVEDSTPQTHSVLAFPPSGALPEDVALEDIQVANSSQTRLAAPASSGEEHDSSNVVSIAQPAPVNPTAAPSYVRSCLDWLLDLMWGRDEGRVQEPVNPPIDDEEHVVDDIANEAPFVPAPRRQQVLQLAAAEEEDNVQEEPPAALDAPANGNDEQNPEDALDDLEDIEGIMELIGMHGPILGLLQNGMFCALLISLAIVAALWIPYMLGKVLLVILARPLHFLQQPLQFASTTADMVVDLCVVAVACSFYWLDSLVRLLCSPFWAMLPASWQGLETALPAETAKSYAESALRRLALASVANGELVTKAMDLPRFSIIAHESLRILSRNITTTASYITHQLVFALDKSMDVLSEHGKTQSAVILATTTSNQIQYLALSFWHAILAAKTWLKTNPLSIRILNHSRTDPLDFTLAAWNSRDRAIAITAGYVSLCLLGVAYLRVIAAIKGTNKKGRANDALAEILYQVGGVMKVILIISIEMIVFPLYCGILLDTALLPLFDGASFMSRMAFVMRSPNTAIFIHWFIGTCYMFHFALFVSMCRKIFRVGVLFFIRDPDDPTFHPVRDVLERNVSTQLWKISFSGLVYGALILACLGATVWGIASAPIGVFPIRWTSSEPILEFPVDILFYNFLVPIAVKYCKPTNGLTNVYKWWFRVCGRWLRLSSFLFEEQNEEEMGRYVYPTWGAVGRQMLPWKLFVRDEKDARQFRRDVGKVKAPSSDQLRIPKGHPTFFRLDESTDRPVVSIHSGSVAFLDHHSDSFKVVYIPPFFRLRIAMLACLVWAFSTGTGLSVTVLPLLLGRYLLSKMTPSTVQMNDIYAVSLGIYVLGGSIYVGVKLHESRHALVARLSLQRDALRAAVHKLARLGLVGLRLFYTYGAFTMFLPALVSMTIECYLIIPLFTFFASQEDASDTAIAAATRAPLFLPPSTTNTASVLSRPVVHLIQDWTIGILYVKVMGRLILWSAPSRAASALRGIVRNGWLDPDVWLATRGFILPSIILVALLLTIPVSLGWIAAHAFFASHIRDDQFFRSCIYRYSYPAVLAIVIAIALVVLLFRAFEKWRKRVKDEVYLIGERLHNYGETRKIKSGLDKGKGKEKVERPVLSEREAA